MSSNCSASRVYFLMSSNKGLIGPSTLLNSLKKFNSIKKDIDTIGWKHYAKHYTLIILAIVIFGSLCYLEIPNVILNYAWVTILNFLMFTTQFLGIGAIYSKIKGN